MFEYLLLIAGIIAVFFPFDADLVEPDRLDNTSLLANLGGEGISMLIKIGGGVLVFFSLALLLSR